MAVANSLLYFLLSSGLSSNPEQTTGTNVQQLESMDGNGIGFCSANEQFSVCGAYSVCQRTCSNRDDEYIPCPMLCISGCVCKEGFVRGPNGRCIELSECEGGREATSSAVEKCHLNEVFSECEGHCQRNCSNWDQEVLICPRICIPGCVCQEGMVRGSNGRCVLPRECVASSQSAEEESAIGFCSANEQFSVCGAYSVCQRTCSNRNDEYIPCPMLCISGCVCKEGFVRGPNGRCIELSECEGGREATSSAVEKCHLNEVFSECEGHCQRNCSNWDQESLICPRICLPGCVCQEGMVRGSNGRCVLPRECLSSSQSSEEESGIGICRTNEEFSFCGAYSLCQRTCSNKDDEYIPCPNYCIAGCVCKEGFVRGLNGYCIEPSHCSSESDTSPSTGRKCPLNEVSSWCKANCQRNCSNWDEDVLICPRKCVSGCVCIDGMVRGPDGKCVYPRDCLTSNEFAEVESDTSLCKLHEDYSYCWAHPVCQRTCANRDRYIPCPFLCVRGCVCIEGYVQGTDGNCIKSSKCTSEGAEVLSIRTLEDDSEDLGVKDGGCPSNKSCNTFCQRYTKRGGICEGKGNRTCRCFTGSPRCYKNHEYFTGCDALCQKNCTNWKKPTPCPKICVPGCLCETGYVRGYNGECIKPDQCPPQAESFHSTPRCYKNHEYFTRCDALCQTNCTNWNKPTPCHQICVPGCLCETGYVRGSNGECIKPDQCPPQTKSFQNQFPIPTMCWADETFSVCPCPVTCDDYKNKKCPSICIPACECKAGLVRGPRGNCIQPDQCRGDKKPEDCTDLEFFDTCGSSCQKDCKNYNLPDKTCDKRCVVGCFCVPGYVRGPDGDCIWPFDCPAQKSYFGGTPTQEKATSSFPPPTQQALEDMDYQYWTIFPAPEDEVRPFADESDFEDSQRVSDEGCPDNFSCNISCRARGKSGRCEGKGNLRCRCV